MQHFIAKDGTPIHFRVQGQGQPLIILHGWTSSHREWQRYAEQLADNYRVYTWDARGHAQHPLPADASTSLTLMAQDLRQLIEHEGLSNSILVGHSMGALTLWKYCELYGCQDLSALCVIDQSPKLVTDDHWHHGIYGNFDTHKNQLYTQRFQEAFAEGVLELAAFGLNAKTFQNYQANTPGFQRLRDYLQVLNHKILVECWKSLTEADLRPVLPTIDVPTLLIYGNTSQFYTLDLAEYVHRAITDSELVIYPNADHSPHLWQPERFLDDLRGFLERQPALRKHA